MVVKTSRAMDKPDVQQTQARVEEVVDIMRANIDKVLEKDQKLKDLNDRAQVLSERGKEFEEQTHKLRKKYCWQNLKMILMLGFVGLVLLVVIAVAIALSVKQEDKEDQGTSQTNPADFDKLIVSG